MAAEEGWSSQQNLLEFTPLELAQHLGKYDYLKTLGGTLPDTFLVQKRGENIPNEISRDAFEKLFQITYRPFLRFPSYRDFKEVIKNCPYILRSRRIAGENYSWMEKYRSQLSQGRTAPILIKWIDETMGYGAFSQDVLNAGDFVGEYTGTVRRLFRRQPDHNAYCFHYPTCFWSFNYFVIDALHEGNLMRFINHSDHPNLMPLCLVDRGLLHLVFVANKPIPRGMELTLDYGQDYWAKRKKI